VNPSGSTPAPDLEQARANVLAIVAGSAMSMRPPTVQAAAPLRALDPALEGKLAARAAAGLTPTGPDHPRGRVWQRVVLPAGSFAAVDAVGAGALAADGHVLLASIAGVLFVPLAVLAAAAGRFAARDPLRLRTDERRAITDASRWESHQVWTGPLASSAERGLVIAAAQAAGRIAGSDVWRSGRIDDQRLQLDLASELDQIDDQAHRIASARHEHSPGSPPALDNTPVLRSAWEATVTRVAALTAYADELDGASARRAEADALRGDPVRDSNLMAGSARDEMAAEQLIALTAFLSADRRTGEGTTL
jgi:hypothetical protein